MPLAQRWRSFFWLPGVWGTFQENDQQYTRVEQSQPWGSHWPHMQIIQIYKTNSRSSIYLLQPGEDATAVVQLQASYTHQQRSLVWQTWWWDPRRQNLHCNQTTCNISSSWV
jgi:hypothetical protein